MYLKIRKTSMDNVIRRSKQIGGKLIEHSYDQKYCEVAALASNGLVSYTANSIDNGFPDAIGVFYNKPEFCNRCIEIGRSIIEFKLKDCDTPKAICQLLAEIMPIRCNLLIDSFTYKKDNYWFLEIFNSKRYYILRLRNPKVKAILDEFSEKFTKELIIAPNTAHKYDIYRYYASKLEALFDCYETEDITEEEIVTMKYREICADKGIDLTIEYQEQWN